jgi:hypothetical protein
MEDAEPHTSSATALPYWQACGLIPVGRHQTDSAHLDPAHSLNSVFQPPGSTLFVRFCRSRLVTTVLSLCRRPQQATGTGRSNSLTRGHFLDLSTKLSTDFVSDQPVLNCGGWDLGTSGISRALGSRISDLERRRRRRVGRSAGGGGARAGGGRCGAAPRRPCPRGHAGPGIRRENAIVASGAVRLSSQNVDTASPSTGPTGKIRGLVGKFRSPAGAHHRTYPI